MSLERGKIPFILNIVTKMEVTDQLHALAAFLLALVQEVEWVPQIGLHAEAKRKYVSVGN
jgi:hypothetical protein